jgi:hypothetical protein
MKHWDISLLNKAVSLLREKTIHLDDVPEELRKNLTSFLFRKTVGKDDKGIVVFKATTRHGFLN